MKLGKVFLGSSPGLLKKFHRNWLKANWRHFVCKAKLYIPSTLNIDLVLGHRGLKLDGAVGQGKICNSLKSGKFSKSFLSHIGKNKIKF